MPSGLWSGLEGLKSAAAGGPALQEDRERQVRRTAAPQEITGPTEVRPPGRKLACLRLVEAELSKLLGAPPQDVILVAD